MKKALKRFNMDNVKPVSTPLASYFWLSRDQSPVTEDEMSYMDKILYASAIGSQIYAMVCTRPNISYEVGIVSWFVSTRQGTLGGC